MIIRKVKVYDFNDIVKLVKKTGCDSRVLVSMSKKGLLEPVTLEAIDNRAANILKQEALSTGADIAVSENVSRFKKGFSDAVLLATCSQIEKLSKKLEFQPFGLKEVSKELIKISQTSFKNKKVLRYKKSKIDLSYPAVMGIINLDANSFSGDAVRSVEEAVAKAKEHEKNGAAMLDIGAESSKPGSKLIDAKTEIKRLIPALKQIRKKTKLPISIDTYKYETAKAAISEGADIINDIFALRHGKEKLSKLISDTKTGVILMHMKGKPSYMQKKPIYKDCVSEVYKFLKEQKEYALSFDIKEDYIAVDPGIGFGKTVENNMDLIKNINTFSSLGAVLGGVSRKRFVQSISGKDKNSFIAANFLTVLCGADIIRVHDVKETYNALKLISKFWRV